VVALVTMVGHFLITPVPKGNTAMTKALVKLQSLRSEKGATAVEYGLMVALIAIVIIAAVALVGTNLDLLFDEVAASL
jgi:pilus assembly protein Flp/PilA